LGVAVTVDTFPVSLAWQPAQFDALGVAAAGTGWMVAAMTATAKPVASTAIFGMVIDLSLYILIGSSMGSGFVMVRVTPGAPAHQLTLQVLAGEWEVAIPSKAHDPLKGIRASCAHLVP